MEARCPSCSNIFATQRTGLQFCPRCGQQVMVADVGEAGTDAAGAGAPPPSTGTGPGAPPPPGFASAGPGGPPPPGAGPGAPPPPGSPALLLGREPTPWERRDQLGFFRALWETWKETMVAPDDFWKKLRPDGPPQDALFYGWLITLASALIQAPMQALQLSVQASAMKAVFAQAKDLPADLRGTIDQLFGAGPAFVVVGLILVGLVVYPVTAIINASLTHLFCMLFGAAKNGFWATFRVITYASAPLVLAGVPVVGAAAAIWSLVLVVWGIMKVQETTAGRAAAAVLALPVVICCCVCGGLTIAFSAIVASIK